MRVSQTGREKEVKWREMLERAQYRGHLSHSCDMLDLLSFKRILSFIGDCVIPESRSACGDDTRPLGPQSKSTFMFCLWLV